MRRTPGFPDTAPAVVILESTLYRWKEGCFLSVTAMVDVVAVAHIANQLSLYWHIYIVGKRKSKRKQAVRKVVKLQTQFNCLFCSSENAIEIKLYVGFIPLSTALVIVAGM